MGVNPGRIVLQSADRGETGGEVTDSTSRCIRQGQLKALSPLGHFKNKRISQIGWAPNLS